VSKAWTTKEENYLRDKIKAGVHPVDFLDEMNKRFNSNRTPESIEKKLGRLQLSLVGCQKKLSVPTLKEAQEIVKKDVQLQRLEAEKKILTQKYSQAVKGAAYQETIIENLRTYIKALPEVEFPTAVTRDPNDVSEEDAVLLLSDLHAGEVVRAEELNGLNKYNFDICTKRLKYLSDSIRDIVKNKLTGYKFKKLHILGLGDFVSGCIHEELLEGNDGNIIEWTTNLAYVLAQMIRELATDFELIEFVGVVGNHGRLTKKPRFKYRYVNWDYVCYQMLSMFLANQKNVKFFIPKSFWTLHTINHNSFLLLHGDNIKSSLSIPWYGISKMVANLKELLEANNQKFNYVVLGHFHNRGLLDNVKGETIINGSLIGGNEYSIGKLFTSSEACQHFCGVHSKRGVTFSYKIKVQEADSISKVPYKYAQNVTALGELVKELN